MSLMFTWQAIAAGRLAQEHYGLFLTRESAFEYADLPLDAQQCDMPMMPAGCEHCYDVVMYGRRGWHLAQITY